MVEKIPTWWYSLLSGLIGVLVGYILSELTKVVRRVFSKPVLQLDFEEGDDYISHTPTGAKVDTPEGKRIELSGEAYYIRIKVTNKRRKIARNCTPYLINVEKIENSKPTRTLYCDSIPLAWSCAGEDNKYIKLDLAKDVNQFIDLLETIKNYEQFVVFIYSMPFRYHEVFKQHGIYLFTVQVVATDAKPATIKIQFTWNGVWDDFEMKKYDK